MQRILHTYCLIALLLGLFLALGVTPAHAQFGAAQRGFTPPVRPKENLKPAEPAPPALPGATSTVAPADKTVLDLPPTESLFDAINRGDMASARDAIGRGADLNERNVLGMTPLDLSVDLSRNDITFLLLSMRGATVGAAPPASAQTAASDAKPTGAKPGGMKSAVVKPARKPAATAAVKPLPLSPRQYAGPADPGTPNPQAGFLGFGSATR